MRFAFRKTGIGLVVGALIFCCSCEKHQLGEMPEAQKEHVDVASESSETSSAPEQSSPTPSPSATPTPAEFFPESTPP
jgi:hypothetical protein